MKRGFPRFTDVLCIDQLFPVGALKAPYDRYLFFDADLRSSLPFLADLESLLKERLSHETELLIHVACNGHEVGRLRVGEDWQLLITKLSRDLPVDDEGYGFSLFDKDLSFVVCQPARARIGVVAMRNISAKTTHLTPTRDSFFQCSDLRAWIENKTPEFQALVDEYGHGFAERILTHYCSTG